MLSRQIINEPGNQVMPYMYRGDLRGDRYNACQVNGSNVKPISLGGFREIYEVIGGSARQRCAAVPIRGDSAELRVPTPRIARKRSCLGGLS
jgi:hypothetical protein